MIKEITSIKNKTVSDVKKLKQKKHREETGTFLAEGYRNVCDSIHKAVPEMVFVTANFEHPVPEGNNRYLVTKEVMKELSDTDTPQGIVAVFKIPKEREITSSEVLLLNGVSDPGNMGTILRTALAAGFRDVIVDEKCADVYSPKVIRSAMSAVFSLNILRVKSLKEQISDLKQMGYSVCGAALTPLAKSIYDTDFSGKIALLFGSESNGIEEALLQMADKLYIIPMDSEIESLNVAVAAGISMYEITAKKKR
ncbi:MAG: RNA methyltransferase [Clostridia bacterium]|nr:RNA methyltransferase [Clostridia bacterium]